MNLRQLLITEKFSIQKGHFNNEINYTALKNNGKKITQVIPLTHFIIKVQLQSSQVLISQTEFDELDTVENQFPKRKAEGTYFLGNGTINIQAESSHSICISHPLLNQVIDISIDTNSQVFLDTHTNTILHLQL